MKAKLNSILAVLKKMHIWDILENLMNTFLGIEGWGWGG